MSKFNANIAAINAVMMASNTTAPNARMTTLSMLPHSTITTTAVLIDETAPNMASYIAAQTNAVTTSAGTAANDANDMMHIDTATAMSPANDETSQLLQFTYSHEEVQQLLEDARLEGYQEGFEEGHETGRKTGHEEGKEDSYEERYNKGSRKWGEDYRKGYEVKGKLNKEKEERVQKEGQFEGHKLRMQKGKDEEQ